MSLFFPGVIRQNSKYWYFSRHITNKKLPWWAAQWTTCPIFKLKRGMWAMVSMGMLNLMLSRYLFSPYVRPLFNADIRTQQVGDFRFHVSSWNRDLFTDRDHRKCTELARAGSCALLSPSTLSLIKTMSSFHLFTKKQTNFVWLFSAALPHTLA